MTTVAYRDGLIAADSRITYETEAGGSNVGRCEKLFRKRVGGRYVVMGLSGESSPGMLFFDWYGTGKALPEGIRAGDFSALILDRGKVYLADQFCRPVEITDPFFAIGSGRKVALGAMDMGASARRAVQAACRHDTYSALPIVTMKMPT